MNQRQQITRTENAIAIYATDHAVSWRTTAATGWAELTLIGAHLTLTECPARGFAQDDGIDA